MKYCNKDKYQKPNTSVWQDSNNETGVMSNIPTFQHSTAPVQDGSNTPLLQCSNTPPGPNAIRFSMSWLLTALFAVVLGLGAIGCAQPAPAPPKPVGEEDILSPPYDREARLKEPEECGECHPRFYSLIRSEGGKHRIDCKQCHVRYHIYRPGKVRYEDVLPKCSACHDQVHGEELALCSECHTNAHAPMKIPAERALAEGCQFCHPEENKEMKTYKTQHTELYCTSCHHTSHRSVAECLECHRPHTEGMTQAECVTCHPPHKTLQIVYPEDIPQESCAGCHVDAYDKMKQSATKHAALSCAKCHPEHRVIVTCRECHPEVHERTDMMEKFAACGPCHGVAHNVTGGA